MKFKTAIAAAFAVALSCVQAFGQATILPPGETCFQATAGINGMVGLLGSITGGSSYTNGTYGGVALTGGSGTGATANITVSGGIVTAVIILNPGIQYVVGDVLSAPAASIGGTGSGLLIPVASTSINSSLAGGSVGFYIPNTQTYKQTWQDAGEVTLNQNPVPLDQNGCAVVYGAGIYLMVVQDSLGNTVYTKLTASTSPQGIFWAGLATGTGNAIQITDTSFALQDGAAIQFRAIASNTGPATVQVSGGALLPIVVDTTSGPAALSGGEIDAFNQPLIVYDSTNSEFHLVNPAESTSGSGGTSSGLAPPQGYLNLVGQASGDVVQTGDVVGVATIFYSPYNGNQIPIWNGSAFKGITFSELTATLTSAGSAASAIQDSCVFSNNGVPTLVTGPAWSVPTAGSGSRGTGAGTAQLTRLQGIWVNSVSIVGYNGLSSYTIPANQCTYVGSLSIDSTAGQVSAYRTVGQNRKFGIWNAYNQQNIIQQEQDSTGSWTDGGGNRWIVSNNGNTNNVITTFTGLPEQVVDLDFSQNATFAALSSATVSAAISIGINSNTSSPAPASFCAAGAMTFNPGSASSALSGGSLKSKCIFPPALGITTIYPLENPAFGGVTTNNVSYFGSNQMLLTAQYRG